MKSKKLSHLVFLCVIILTTTIVFAEGWDTPNYENQPEARFGHQMVTLPDGKVMLFAGADSGVNLFNDLHQFNGSNWSSFQSTGVEPPAFVGHSMTVMNNGQEPVIMIFGGKDALGNNTSTLYKFDLNTGELTEQEYDGNGPPNRSYHNAFEHEDELYVMGGRDTPTLYGDVWSYNLSENIWTQKADAPYPFARANFGKYNNKIYVQKVDGVYTYDIAKDEWSDSTITHDLVDYREGASVAQIGSKFYSFGGYIFGGIGATNETLIFDMETGEFSNGSPMPESIELGSAAVFTDSSDGKQKILVTGGSKSDGSLNYQDYVYTPDIELAVEDECISNEFLLYQNYPNPFNPETTISFSIPQSQHVKLVIYDILGNKISTLVNEYKSSGVHSVVLNMEKLASGIYFYRLTTESFNESKKLVVQK